MAPKEELARGATLAKLAAQVGHPGCRSGVDITLLTAREFVVDPASLQVRDVVPEL
jgi:hypothetical protein